MKKHLKKLLSIVLVVATIFSISALMPTTALAASQTTNYSNYTTPGSSDYAYWNGKKMVKQKYTTTSNVKWMQASLNYCIKYKGLSASYLDVDGSFGPASKKTTLAFQKKYGLSQDGSFGPGTISKMKSVLSSSSKTNNTNAKYNLLWPVPSNSGYKVSSRMGTRTAPLPGGSTNHKGIDIARVKAGTKIYAVASGTVISKGYSSKRGYYVVILHSDQNLISIYQHMLSSSPLSKNNYVRQGDVVGYVGSTGNSTANHLHFGLVVANSTKSRTVDCDQSGTLINPIQSNSNINYTYKK